VNVLLFAFNRVGERCPRSRNGVRGPGPWQLRNNNGFPYFAERRKIPVEKVMSSYFAEQTTSRGSTKRGAFACTCSVL
jgi:hypothetical protein